MLWCEFLYRDTADLLQSARLSRMWDGHIIVDATRTVLDRETVPE
jgi:hypothetical protein